jgi:hypothetical protein
MELYMINMSASDQFLFKEDNSCNLKPLVSVLLASYIIILYM